MACCIHYPTYNKEKLLPLEEHHLARMVEAKNARLNLGGDNVHHDQGSGVPSSFTTGIMFHLKCYKKYTKAISVWNKRCATSSAETDASSTSSSMRLHRSGDIGGVLFPKYCMLCKSVNPITVNGKKQYPKVLCELRAENSIREAASLHKDSALLTSIMPESLSLRCAEFKVHEKCRKDYTRICPPSTKRAKMDESAISSVDGVDDGIISDGEPCEKREEDDCNLPSASSQTRNEEDDIDSYSVGDSERLFRYIREHVILVSQAISMQVLTNVYGFDGSNRKQRYYVKQLIVREFKDDILVLNDPYEKKPQIVVRAKAYQDGELLHESNKNYILRHAAQFLKNDVDDFVAKEKGEEEVWPPTVESLNKTRTRYPGSLQDFFTALFKNRHHSAGENVLLAVNSVIDDVINSLSNGTILTPKHILLGCGMHSLSGSKLDIEIMHKMNNSCSYDQVRRIETAQAELAIELSERQFPLPLVPKDEYSSVLLRLWYDNFDVNKENKEGSIHTCHGVAYTESSPETQERNSNIQLPKSSRRSLVKEVVKLPVANIVPHRLPPLLKDAKDTSYDRSYASFLPLLWKIQRQICHSNQSVSHRYVGWTSSIFKKEQERTHITFLPPINNPITEFSTVIECLYQSEKLGEACNMKYIHITADVGAACKFYQVIWNNPERFKNCIIHLGDFHAMQELFSIIGKIVTESGFEDVLYQADLCTSGGIKGVLSGKHYNRSWKIHECLAESLHRLLVEREPEALDISNKLRDSIKAVKDAVSCQALFEDSELKEYCKKFNKIEDQYLNGEKGKTAQYWAFYMKLVQLVQELHYSINVNDFHLRLKCWRDLVVICFPTNKRNYARYGSYYIELMKNLPTTHPGAVEELLEKGISVRRNDIGIGQSIDGAGEQTFMRSSKTKGGIKSFTSNIATYNKWVLSRPFQAKFVEALLEMIGKNEAGSHLKALRKSEIDKSEGRIKKMCDILTNTFLNPFASDLDENKLFNIASGCPISDEAANCLLGIKSRGEELYLDFQERLSGNHGANFWNAIKTEEWKDFDNSNRTSKARTSNGKTIEVKVQRDILGFLLAKSQEMNATIQIEECLKYPLCPVELSIAHGDGRKRKSNKSALLPYILQPEATPPPNPDSVKVYILDLAAIVRSTVKVPDTFEELAIQIWNDIPEKYMFVYVACDTYHLISIKSFERKERGEANKFLIRSAKVRIPPNFQKFLCNGDNKERLFELIETVWVSQKRKLGNRVVYFARGDSCIRISNDCSVLVPELKTNHEEADTKIAYLIQHSIEVYSPVEILVRSRSGDVDIPVILTGIFGSSTTPITVDNGTGKHRKSIRIDSSVLSGLQCKAIVGFHSFFANDYISSFLRRSKKFWEKVREDGDSLEFFNNLGSAPLSDDLFAAAEKFVCVMYGDKKCASVNTLRNKLLWKHYRKNGKIIDLSLLPPCSSSLRKHTSRAYYVAKIWKNAHVPFQDIEPFTNFCWFSDGSIDWIDTPYPNDIADLFGESEGSQDISYEDMEGNDDLDDESDVDDEEQDQEE